MSRLPRSEIAWPVIEPAFSLHSQSTVAATSSGWMKPALRIGGGENGARFFALNVRSSRRCVETDVVQHVRLDKARTDRVDGDAGLGGLGGKRPHQPDHTVLGRDIGRDIGVALEAGDGGDEDDAAGLARGHAG